MEGCQGSFPGVGGDIGHGLRGMSFADPVCSGREAEKNRDYEERLRRVTCKDTRSAGSWDTLQTNLRHGKEKAGPLLPSEKDLGLWGILFCSLGQSFYFFGESFSFSFQIHISEVNFQKYL